MNPMFIYQLIIYILVSAGFRKILQKCGRKGWQALMPGYRWYALGECCGRGRDGMMITLLEIVNYSIGVILQFANFPEDSEIMDVFALIILTSILILIVFRIRVGTGVSLIFNANRWWNILWGLQEWIPALWFGFHPRLQPIYIDRYSDDPSLAGTRPAELEAAIASRISREDAAGDGLHVRLRQRTARDMFRTRYLLKDIRLDIPNGSLVLLLGGSGAGKTTLVNAINGYEKADADVWLNGRSIYDDYDQMKYRIGFVPQQDLLRMNDTVSNTMNDAARLRLPKDYSRARKNEIISSVMETLGMASRKEGLIARKSGGQKKRISIGMELISDPELFILDEPDSGLDGVIARELFEKLRAVADTGKIVIAITHTPDRVADLFDMVIVLARDSGRVGRMAFCGTPEEARRFFGRDTMERIVMAVNNKDEGGEGRADEFIAGYAAMISQDLRSRELRTEAESGKPAGKKKKKKKKKGKARKGAS